MTTQAEEKNNTGRGRGGRRRKNGGGGGGGGRNSHIKRTGVSVRNFEKNSLEFPTSCFVGVAYIFYSPLRGTNIIAKVKSACEPSGPSGRSLSRFL